jgi:glycosyltransferase involved in cell wall biosynthesis
MDKKIPMRTKSSRTSFDKENPPRRDSHQKKVKTCLMVGWTAPQEGGSERHIYELASRIPNSKVFTQKGSLCEKKIEVNISGGSFIGNVLFALASLFYSLRLVLAFRKKYDLVHLHENLTYFLVPLLRLRYEVVVTMHGMKGFKYYDNKSYWLFFRQGLKFANRLIAVNLSDKELLERYFDPSKIVYVPNGVDTSIYQGLKVKVERKIGFIGRVHEQKGIIYLLEAFEKISKEDKEVRLEIIGEVNDYAKKLQKKFPNKNIDWKGYQSNRDKIARMLSSSWCIALPSLWEGLPLTLFESLASKRPLVVSKIPAFESVIKNEAIFCKVKDSDSLAKELLRVLSDYKLADSIGAKGNKLSKKYDWNSLARELEGVYENA